MGDVIASKKEKEDVSGRGFAQTISLSFVSHVSRSQLLLFITISLGAQLLVWAFSLSPSKKNHPIQQSSKRIRCSHIRWMWGHWRIIGKWPFVIIIIKITIIIIIIIIAGNTGVLPGLCTASNLIYKVRLPLPLPQREGPVCTEACQKNWGKLKADREQLHIHFL